MRCLAPACVICMPSQRCLCFSACCPVSWTCFMHAEPLLPLLSAILQIARIHPSFNARKLAAHANWLGQPHRQCLETCRFMQNFTAVDDAHFPYSYAGLDTIYSYSSSSAGTHFDCARLGPRQYLPSSHAAVFEHHPAMPYFAAPSAAPGTQAQKRALHRTVF